MMVWIPFFALLNAVEIVFYCYVAQNLAVQGGDVSGSDLLASKYAPC
jgi:hypothetical protein